VSDDESTIQISKIAAAQRQLDAAIRMFFQREDELAIHTVAAAALQILRDVTKDRGDHFTSDVFREGILNFARQYVQGTLSPDKRAMAEGSSYITALAERICREGDNFDKRSIRVDISKKEEHELWLSETTVFLKHADRDPKGFLSVGRLDNERMLIGTCVAYVNLMNQQTPEIEAYHVFWRIKNGASINTEDEAQLLAEQLQSMGEAQRYARCAKFIRDAKAKKMK
jgi:hypothetical protein